MTFQVTKKKNDATFQTLTFIPLEWKKGACVHHFPSGFSQDYPIIWGPRDRSLCQRPMLPVASAACRPQKGTHNERANNQRKNAGRKHERPAIRLSAKTIIAGAEPLEKPISSPLPARPTWRPPPIPVPECPSRACAPEPRTGPSVVHECIFHRVLRRASTALRAAGTWFTDAHAEKRRPNRVILFPPFL